MEPYIYAGRVRWDGTVLSCQLHHPFGILLSFSTIAWERKVEEPSSYPALFNSMEENGKNYPTKKQWNTDEEDKQKTQRVGVPWVEPKGVKYVPAGHKRRIHGGVK